MKWIISEFVNLIFEVSIKSCNSSGKSLFSF